MKKKNPYILHGQIFVMKHAREPFGAAHTLFLNMANLSLRSKRTDMLKTELKAEQQTCHVIRQNTERAHRRLNEQALFDDQCKHYLMISAFIVKCNSWHASG